MAKTDIVTLDLNFQGIPHSIACYLVQHSAGAVLVECGPGSTIPQLTSALMTEGLRPADITHVLLTHIHLDHAGAAGWLARQGAEIVVHPNGAPHLISPERLLSSASRIYGEQMNQLWGEMLPVPQERISTPVDGQEIAIGSLHFTALDMPGHAEHHLAYVLDETCFSGDVGGVRIQPYHHVRVPMPPPELNIPKWRHSLGRLRSLSLKQIAPTHFGVSGDPLWQLDEVERGLDEAERWLEREMAAQPAIEVVRSDFKDWIVARHQGLDLPAEAQEAYELANPPAMSADGLFRYWNKVRLAA
jgi:glyoxylase-like metal-dependent hydrolase (beta-lactamase superfamily II)